MRSEPAAEASTPRPPTGSGERSWLVTALLLLLIAVVVFVILDRRLLLSEKRDLQDELARLYGRLEAATEVLSLRAEVERLSRDQEALRESAAAAQRALELVGAGQRLEAQPLEPLAGKSSGRAWLLLPDGWGPAFFMGTDLRELPPGAEYVLIGALEGGPAELCRFRATTDGSAVAAFNIPAEQALLKAWLKLARRGGEAEGTPLLLYDREVTPPAAGS